MERTHTTAVLSRWNSKLLCLCIFASVKCLSIFIFSLFSFRPKTLPLCLSAFVSAVCVCDRIAQSNKKGTLHLFTTFCHYFYYHLTIQRRQTEETYSQLFTFYFAFPLLFLLLPLRFSQSRVSSVIASKAATDNWGTLFFVSNHYFTLFLHRHFFVYSPRFFWFPTSSSVAFLFYSLPDWKKTSAALWQVRQLH